MIRNKTLVFALAGAFAVGGAGLAYAQVHEGGGMGMMGSMGMTDDCPMMRAMGQSPAAVLEHGDALALTPEQIARLESLRESGATARAETMAAMREAHRDIEALTTEESFDEAAARDAFGRMGDLHARMGLAMARARHETREILTPEQRDHLTDLSSRASGMMHGMHGMHRMGGMEGIGRMEMRWMGGMMEMMRRCPMMRGGMGDDPGVGMPERGSLR